MENTIYIANEVAAKLKALPPRLFDKVADLIDSLNGDGWKNSQIIHPDPSLGGGLRSKSAGDIRLLFSHVPEKNAIIVAGVTEIYERELAAA
jgi:mRNA-degrading endonuclease RelE of RelBE toxin-antitoxin system